MVTDVYVIEQVISEKNLSTEEQIIFLKYLVATVGKESTESMHVYARTLESKISQESSSRIADAIKSLNKYLWGK